MRCKRYKPSLYKKVKYIIWSKNLFVTNEDKFANENESANIDEPTNEDLPTNEEELTNEDNIKENPTDRII